MTTRWLIGQAASVPFFMAAIAILNHVYGVPLFARFGLVVLVLAGGAAGDAAEKWWDAR